MPRQLGALGRAPVSAPCSIAQRAASPNVACGKGPPLPPARPAPGCGGERAAITHCGKNEMLENTRRGIQGWDRARAAPCNAARDGHPTARAPWGPWLPRVGWGATRLLQGEAEPQHPGSSPCHGGTPRSPLPATWSWPGHRAGPSAAVCPCPPGSGWLRVPAPRDPAAPASRLHPGPLSMSGKEEKPGGAGLRHRKGAGPGWDPAPALTPSQHGCAA